MRTFVLNRQTMKHINGYRKEDRDLTIHDILTAGDISPLTPIGQLSYPELMVAIRRAKKWYYKRARYDIPYGPFDTEAEARADAIQRFPV